jgi:hypothetical protein
MAARGTVASCQHGACLGDMGSIPILAGWLGSLVGQNTKGINGHKGNLHVGVTGRTVGMRLLSREQTPR